jgi:hypothetical protein
VKKRVVFRRAFRILCALSAVSVLLFTAALGDDRTPPDGFDSWADYYDSLINGGSGGATETPSLEEMMFCAQNDRFSLRFHEAGMDFYIEDKQSGKIWSTDIDPEYIDVGGLRPEDYSALLEVSLADNEEGVSVYSLISREAQGFSVLPRATRDGMTLDIVMPKEQIAFSVEIWLEEDGFCVSIPEKSLREEGTKRLLSVAMLPRFGTARTGEDGYIFYPDGSGALVDIKPYPYPKLRSYAYPIYGLAEADADELLKREEQGIMNLMLPIFGIKHTDGGFLAAIVSGDADAALMMEMMDSYSAYFRFDYRKYVTASFNYTGTSFGGGEIKRLLAPRIEGDRMVRYFLLTGQENTYSHMAEAYRNSLEANGILTRAAKSDTIPLSVEFFMAVRKNGIGGSYLQSMTGYRQAADILTDLGSSGVGLLQALLTAWGEGGYEAMPTAADPAGTLGGKSGFSALTDACKRDDILLFAGAQYLLADNRYGSFNAKKDVLLDLLGTAVTDEAQNTLFMNPAKTLREKVETAVKKSDGAFLLSLTDAGRLVLPNHYEKEVTYRTQIVEALCQALVYLKERQGRASVSGGNAYVLPYSSRLYEIPDRDSRYVQNSRAVPFYQMVIHGSVDYTSVAGNLSDSVQIQKLRWVETGSLPHFLLTGQSSEELRDTGYSRIFSSQYPDWKETVLQTAREFNERLSAVWNLRITRHVQLAPGLVRLTYEDGSKTYINYNASDAEGDGLTVPAGDYKVIPVGKEGT